jgi:hypothetical protein
VTDAVCVESDERFPYLVLNQEHVVFIEEMTAAPAGPTVAAG